MAELPFEIITEILLRLPVKSLLRFKCVCKFLNSLIKTPNFIKLHLNQTLISSSDVHLLKWSNFLSSLYSAELDFQHNNLYFSELHHALGTQKVSFFGSCNGVVCISDTSKNNIVLFNPLTKSHVKLPLPAYRIPMLEHECISYGFGYDSNNNDYKVLKIVQGIKYNFYFYNKAEVFSVNNHQWKSVQTIPYCFNYNDLYGALVNEALHYMVINQESDSKSCRFIACFDLRTECFSFMDLPCYDDNLMMSNSKGVLYFLRQLGGCLSVMVNYYTDDYLHMLPNNRVLHGVDLWVMKEYGNKQSWVKLFSTRFDELMNIQSCLYIWPIVYSKDGRRILIDVDSFKIGCYDLVSKEFTKFTSHGLPHLSFNSDFFVGSLVSLKDKLHPVKGSLPMKDSNR